MIARESEMRRLEELYESKKFECLVMYGRRRVGKTTILTSFAEKYKAIFFSAQKLNDALSLRNFSNVVQRYYGLKAYAPFQSWEDAFLFLSDQAKKEHVCIIIDEFPFLAEGNPAIKSILQHTIDHCWQNDNIFLILCGSSIAFMENEVMGYKSPLYGRHTEKMEIKPFDYLDSSRFFPSYSVREKLLAYGILGGVPRYMAEFDNEKTLEENLESCVLREGRFLNEEPISLLKMELREPRVYNSILEAIAKGRNRMVEIADYIAEDKTKCATYLLSLQALRLIEKKTPCGENGAGRKGIYELTDNFFRFWYYFILPNESYYLLAGERQACREIMEDATINTYMGLVFEQVCKQYLLRQIRKGTMPFIPHEIGKWWGNNPAKRQQDDIDILVLDKKKEKGIFCECKYKNRPVPMEEYEELLAAGDIFPYVKEKYFIFFSAFGFADSARKRAEKEGVMLVTGEDLYG